MPNWSKGFTLIELLVVIAIIGILSSIVLASLTTTRGRATDAKIKAQLASVRAKAEIYNTDNNNSYGIVVNGNCATAGSMFVDVNSGMAAQLATSNFPGSTLTCYSTAGAYAVSAILPGVGAPNSWCVDSSGDSMQRGTAINSTTC